MRYLLFTLAFCCILQACNNNTDSIENPFLHGVASGDPLPDAVVIWSRISIENATDDIRVNWEMAKSEDFSTVDVSGTITTNPTKDYTLKNDVTGLAPNTYYYYRFEYKGQYSPVGRTKTVPKEKAESVQLGVVSCSNYEAGYFNAYARLAEKEGIDAVLHLGDYIYEYEPNKYGDTTLTRKHEPAKELIELADYRGRYAQYRRDADLQKVHQMHPFIMIWDDHEIMNNANMVNAENHQEEEGDYTVRIGAAKKAYYEWMPIRESEVLYRKFSFGNLVDLVMLDERLAGRSEQIYNEEQGDFREETRTMLGETQLNWLTEQLKNTTAKWKVIGNQVLFANLNFQALRPNSPYNMDAWDGYPAEKKKLKEFVSTNKVDNLIFVTGDTHCSWAFDVPTVVADYKTTTNNSIAVEFGTPGVTSSNYDESYAMDKVEEIEKTYLKDNPHLRYVDLHSQGYFILSLDNEKATAKYFYVDKINEPDEKETMGKAIVVKDKENRLSL